MTFTCFYYHQSGQNTNSNTCNAIHQIALFWFCQCCCQRTVSRERASLLPETRLFAMLGTGSGARRRRATHLATFATFTYTHASVKSVISHARSVTEPFAKLVLAAHFSRFCIDVIFLFIQLFTSRHQVKRCSILFSR